MQKALETSRAVAVLGPSGGGKSAVVKGWADDLDPKNNRVVWFSAGELDALSALDREARLDSISPSSSSLERQRTRMVMS